MEVTKISQPYPVAPSMIILLIFGQQYFLNFPKLAFGSFAKHLIQKSFLFPHLEPFNLALQTSINEILLFLIQFLCFIFTQNVHFFNIPAVVVSRLVVQYVLGQLIHLFCELSIFNCGLENIDIFEVWIRRVVHYWSYMGENRGIVYFMLSCQAGCMLIVVRYYKIKFCGILLPILYLDMATVIDQPLKIKDVETKPYQGQKPGTSGLRKKVAEFVKPNYLHNFIQAYFNAIRKDALSPKNTLLVGGDGRYFSSEAIEIVAQLACGNGVSQLHIAKDGIMSTPACSAYIRGCNEEIGNSLGGILLTASHNPGGPTEDFGVKFNSRNGGPAQEQFTNLVHEQTKHIESYSVADYTFLKTVDITKTGQYRFSNVDRPGKPVFVIKVVENVEHYVDLMRQEFDFKAIQGLLDRSDFKMVFDSMHGAAGPYAKAIFGRELGNRVVLKDCNPSPDFNKGHPDPNLICAKELVDLMGLESGKSIYDFGVSCDGDADRNMILGKCFFVTPSDSLALLTSLSHHFLKSPLKGVARSMPTSGAVDKVVKKMGVSLYETPTGWKFFGNLMEKGWISMCGEESFGTGSPHVRQKDGVWTILAWLQVLAVENKDTKQGNLVSVEDLMKRFWKTYGRNYYTRYDYQNIDTEKGNKIWSHLEQQVPKHKEGEVKGRVFDYVDPVDKSLSKNQGLIFAWQDGSRVVFRKSGTGSVGITLRIYFQKYQPENILQPRQKILSKLIQFGLSLSQVKQYAGRQKPDVIT